MITHHTGVGVADEITSNLSHLKLLEPYSGDVAGGKDAHLSVGGGDVVCDCDIDRGKRDRSVLVVDATPRTSCEKLYRGRGVTRLGR